MDIAGRNSNSIKLKNEIIRENEMYKNPATGKLKSATIVILMTGTILVSLPVTNVLAAEEKDSNLQIEEIIVTSRKVSENLQEVPIAITAHTGTELSRQGLTNIAEIGDLVPNMEFDSISAINGSSSTPNINIRGIGTTDFLLTIDPSVGVYLDGVYVARSVGGLFDLLDVERVEVLRGPQGTLFGRNTIGGAVQIISKKPDEEFHFTAEATTGTDNRHDFRASISGALSENLFASLALSSKRRDGYGRRLDYFAEHPELKAPIANITIFDESKGFAGIVARPPVNEQPGNENKRAARLNVVFEPTENFSLSLSADYSWSDETSPALVLLDVFLDDLSAPTPGVQNPLTGNEFKPNIAALHQLFGFAASTVPYDKRFIIGDHYSTYASGPGGSKGEIWGISSTADWHINSQINLKSITAYREIDSLFGQDPDHSPFTLDAHTNHYTQNQFSQEFQLNGFSFNSKLKWVLGAYYFKENGLDRVIVPLLHGLVLLDEANAINNRAWAVFGQGTYDLTERTSLTAGLRYTSENKKYAPTHVDHGPANALGSQITLPDGTHVLLIGRAEKDFKNASPYVSIAHHWSDDIMTYLSFSRGFKSGGFTGRTVAFIPDQKPVPFNEEKASTFELGFKSNLFDNRARLNAAFFTTNFTNLQVTVQSGVAPITANAGKARINGAEFEFTAVVTENLNFNATIGLLDSKYNKKPSQLGDHLVNAPNATFNLGFDYTAQLGQEGYSLVLRGDYTHKSTIYNNAENTAILVQAPVDLINASLTLESPDNIWSITFGGKNLTDESYLITGFFQPGVGYTEGVYARPREWYLSGKLTF